MSGWGNLFTDESESALAVLVVQHGLEQMLLLEIGPQHVGEPKLCIRDLPQQEVADALLTTGANEQFGVRHTGGGEVLRACTHHPLLENPGR